MTEGTRASVYIGVGSNIDPQANIPRALEMLQKHVRVLACSTFYRTAAIGRPEQEPYLNGVWLIETSAEPRELKFGILRPIEGQLGRVRTQDKYAPRTIDLDVLLYGDLVLEDVNCRIPAPEIYSRDFVQAALLELAPDLLLPDTRKPLASLIQTDQMAGLEACPDFTDSLRSRLRPSTGRSGHG